VFWGKQVTAPKRLLRSVQIPVLLSGSVETGQVTNSKLAKLDFSVPALLSIAHQRGGTYGTALPMSDGMHPVSRAIWLFRGTVLRIYGSQLSEAPLHIHLRLAYCMTSNSNCALDCARLKCICEALKYCTMIHVLWSSARSRADEVDLGESVRLI